MKELVLVHEPEAVCAKRLITLGYKESTATDIASYLAQATDIQADLVSLEAACTTRSIALRMVELDLFDPNMCGPDSWIWAQTDGIAYYRGSIIPPLAQHAGAQIFGSSPEIFQLAQDKFLSTAMMSALGVPVPASGLVENGNWLSPIPASENGYFVKPNRLGSKIGISERSRAESRQAAEEYSRDIFRLYGDRAIVQAYVPGENIRVSYLDVNGRGNLQDAGIYRVDSGADFQSMEDSLALYGQTGEAAKASDLYSEPDLDNLRHSAAEVAGRIENAVHTLATGLGLAQVFSVDLRVTDQGELAVIEFEVSPGLPCFDFRTYVRDQWKMELSEAMAEAVLRAQSH